MNYKQTVTIIRFFSLWNYKSLCGNILHIEP